MLVELPLQSRGALTILFEWESLTFDDLARLCAGMNIKNIRWLAIHHPDNRTRENLYRLSNVEVGERTVINYGLFIYDAYKPMVRIGARCALAANISLVPESFPNMSELGEMPEVLEHYVKAGDIVIEDDAWLGANVIVLPGVTIGHHAIVGAGSIVTRDVPPYAVVKGRPAKVARMLAQGDEGGAEAAS